MISKQGGGGDVWERGPSKVGHLSSGKKG
jgi:hypothetical protein